MLSKIQITPYLTQNLPQPQQNVHSGVTGATILAGFMLPSSSDNPKGKLEKLALQLPEQQILTGTQIFLFTGVLSAMAHHTLNL